MDRSRDDCDFDEPWPIFADEEEPWKNLDLLLRLEATLEYQYQIADAVGTGPSTVSYWMDKAKEKQKQERLEAGTLCTMCEDAEVPAEGEACGSCLDEARAADAGADYDHYPDHLEGRLA